MVLTSEIVLAGMNITYRFLPLGLFFNDMKKLEIDHIELWGGAPHFYSEDIDSADIFAMKKALTERSFHLVCFTPEQCQYPINIASEDQAQRERSIRFFERNMQITSELGCDLMLITPGRGYLNDTSGKMRNRSIDAIGHLTQKAQEYGVRLGLEVLRRDESDIIYNLKTLKDIVEQIDSPFLGAILDTIPMALAHEIPIDYLNTFKEKLFHIHFIDGSPHGHLAWGDGILDSKSYLLQLAEGGYSGALSLEITDMKYVNDPYQAFKKSVDQLKKIDA